MVTALDGPLMSEMSEMSGLIAERMGLHFPEERWPDLARGLKAAGEELGFAYPNDCVGWLRKRELTGRQIETLASHLTVGETYLFRDPASFEVLEREILPPLIAQRAGTGRSLRMWSAGCCTGEEAYSLAITCKRALPDIQSWSVSILATDINPKFLAKGEAGAYSDWSFRGAPGWLRERYFSPAPDKKLSIDPTVKNMVHFGYLNLAEDAYPALHNGTNAMDVILCRNVLMYFTPEHQRRVATALYRCLVDGGCLLVNPAEAGSSLFPMFAMENIGGVILYRKILKPIRDKYGSPEPFVPPPLSVAPELPGPVEHLVPELPEQAVFAPAPFPVAATSCEDRLAKARTCADQGRLADALISCREAIAAERTNPVAHFLYAIICHELGRLEEAVAALRKVLYLDQDFVLAHHALGGLYRRLGKRKESRHHFAAALDLLVARGREEVVPESDGMTCGRLAESVRAMMGD
jgi:chemotaxis protein methyltransferase CheR